MKQSKLSVFLVLCLISLPLGLRAEEGRKIAKSTEEYIQDLNSGDVYLQQEACRYLGKKKENSAIDPLVFLLEEEDVDRHVRAAAAIALAQIGSEDKAIFNTFLNVVHETKDPVVLHAVFLGMGMSESYKESKDSDEIKDLLLEMERSPDIYLQRLAKRLRAKYAEKN